MARNMVRSHAALCAFALAGFAAHVESIRVRGRASLNMWPQFEKYSPAEIKALASPGCKGKLQKHNTTASWVDITVKDYINVKRKFWHYAPKGAGTRGSMKPVPLVIAMHGQTGESDSFASDHDYQRLGRLFGFISAYPQGANDTDKANDQGTGWNTDSGGDPTVCKASIKKENTGCYKSCNALKKCGRCNWSTCLDDALFIDEMLKNMFNNYCIDMGRVYAQGESNGAMALHTLLKRFPGTFAAVSPWFGQPLIGYGLTPGDIKRHGEKLRETAMLYLHLRHDVTIPVKGGISEDKWIFVPLDEELAHWAKIHGCTKKPVRFETPEDDGEFNLECEEYMFCTSGRRVVKCMYDGEHGNWPSDGRGDDAAMKFFLNFRRTKVWPMQKAPPRERLFQKIIRTANAAWGPKAQADVEAKLAKAGITTLPTLRKAMSSSAGLNSRLEKAGLAPFGAATVAELNSRAVPQASPQP